VSQLVDRVQASGRDEKFLSSVRLPYVEQRFAGQNEEGRRTRAHLDGTGGRRQGGRAVSGRGEGAAQVQVCSGVALVQ
jgi:hypothetical protein